MCALQAKRYRYANADMEDLERQLQAAQEQRFRIIVTDGVFSMMVMWHQ